MVQATEGQSTVRSTEAEVVDLRRQVESLQGRLTGEHRARNARRRRLLAHTLTVLAALAVTLALLGVWTFRTLTDTDRFVARVGPVIEQPEVAAAVGQVAAAELVQAIGLEEHLRDALPPEVAAAAAPITNAAQSFLAEGATELIGTDQFQAAWDAALASGHRITIAILSGQDTAAVQNGNGVIVLDLTPVINQLLAQGSEMVSDLLGRQISAPTVSAQTVDEAVQALETRLGVDLPADFGQVTLYASDDLAAAQNAYQTIRWSVWLAPLAAVLLAGLAIAASTRRVRTALGIVVGSGLLLLLVGLTLQPLQSAIVSAVEDRGLSGAVREGFDTVLSSLRSGIVVVVVLGALAAVALYLSGSSRGAVAARRLARRSPELAAAHRGWFLGGGAALILVVLAVVPGRSWAQILTGLLVYGAYALAVLLAPTRGAPERPADGTGDGAGPSDDRPVVTATPGG